MSGPLTVRAATRRFVGLTALHWLPVGLSAPVTVLLAAARGLSPGATAALTEELNGVLARWRAEREEPGQPLVHVLLDLFPLPQDPG